MLNPADKGCAGRSPGAAAPDHAASTAARVARALGWAREWAPGRARASVRVCSVAAAAAAALFALAGHNPHANASSGEGTLEPNGRGLQLLGAREAILLEQSEQARRGARARALNLYRLLRVAALERRATTVGGAATSAAAGADAGGARAVALATAVLARDLDEARALRAELDRVRDERAAIGLLPDGRGSTQNEGSRPQAPLPAFLRPVSGALLLPFGVGRDAVSGAWIFRAAATFAAKPGELVRSPGDGRIARVSGSIAGGAAVVLSSIAVGDAAGAASPSWTVVLSGLASVAVAPGESVRRGDPLGTAAGDGAATVPGDGGIRVETWRGLNPVDPAAVLRAR